MNYGARRDSLVVQHLHDLNITIRNAKLFVIIDLARRFVRLVQSEHTDAIRMRRVKAFDVKRRDRSYVFAVVLTEKCEEVLIGSGVMSHVFHHGFNLGPELARLSQHTIVHVPVTIGNGFEFQTTALSDRKRLGRFAVNELRAELNGPFVRVSVDAATNSLARFEYDDFELRDTQLARRRKSSRTRSDNDDVCIQFHILAKI